MVVYTSHRLVVCRTLPIRTMMTTIDPKTDGGDSSSPSTPAGGPTATTLHALAILPQLNPHLAALVYRGHASHVTAVAVSQSGAYIASGDDKGSFKVWAFDHVEHLCKYSLPTMLSGPIHDIAWDGESKRILLCGERAPTDTMTGVHTKIVQWDTGVSIVSTTGMGMGVHMPRGRATACAIKLSRPLRIVTAGREDGKLLFHGGPPFTKIVPVATANNDDIHSKDPPPQPPRMVPTETAHKTGTTIHAVRYHPSGTLVASVGSDKALCLYDGTQLSLLCKLEHIHLATVYDVAWSSNHDDTDTRTTTTTTGTKDTLLTASGDGTCKLFAVVKNDETEDQTQLQLLRVWYVAQYQLCNRMTASSSSSSSSFPVGGIQMGCTFVQDGTIPIAVGYNGQIVQLLESQNRIDDDPNATMDTGTVGTCQMIATGHCAPISATTRMILTNSTTPTSTTTGTMNTTAFTMYTGDTDGVICQWDIVVPPTLGTTNTATCATPRQRVEPVQNTDLLYVTHHGAISGMALLHHHRTKTATSETAACGSSSCNSEEPILLSVGWDDLLYVSLDSQVKHSIPLGAQPCGIASGTSMACIATVKGLLLVIPTCAVAVDDHFDTASPAVVVAVSPMIPIPYEAQALTITSCDTTLFVGGKDCNIYVYTIDPTSINSNNNNGATSLSSSSKLLTLRHTIKGGHFKPIYSLSLSHDGTKLASADDRDVCVWDITSQLRSSSNSNSNHHADDDRPPTALVSRGKWCFHTQRITALAWSLCDRMVMSGSADDSIYIWCLEKKMTRIHYNYTHRGGVISLHCIPSSSSSSSSIHKDSSSPKCHQYQLISTGVDSVVNVWDITRDIQKKFGLH
jgi:WD repeat-containing protein 1 (actin-interacting protein 1)